MDRSAEREQWIGRCRLSGLDLNRFADRHGLNPGKLH
jgi:hypothetical protein